MQDLVGTTLEGKYRLVRIIGEGGMGVVFEAHHLLLGRKLAVKVLHQDVARDPGVVQRFHNEARITAALGHENIIEVTDMGVLPSGAPFLVMEYLEGETLAHRIESAGPLPIDEAVEVVVQVLDALSVVHEAGVVHRDLKPDNVFLASRVGAANRGKSAVRLLDFGISKFREAHGPALNLTRTGTTLGTPYYMAPEQAAGKKQVDHRLDLYAVGVILYEALTGKRPFEGDTYNAILAAILTEPFVAPAVHRPEIPAKLDRIVSHSLCRNPADRFGSAEEFLRALEPFAPSSVSSRLKRSQSGPRMAQSAVGTPAARVEAADDATTIRGGRRNRWLAAAAVAILAAGTVAVVVAALSRGGSTGSTAPDAGGAVVVASSAGVDVDSTAPGGSATARAVADSSVRGNADAPSSPAAAGSSGAGEGAKLGSDGGAAATAPVSAGEAGDAAARADSGGEEIPAASGDAGTRESASGARAQDAGPGMARAPEPVQVGRDLERLRGGVATCFQGRSGTAVCRITLAGRTGTVRDAVATAGLGAQVDRCVEGLLRGFRVAPFAQDELDVTHTFRVRVARPPETRDAGADRGTTPSIDRELPQ